MTSQSLSLTIIYIFVKLMLEELINDDSTQRHKDIVWYESIVKLQTIRWRRETETTVTKETKMTRRKLLRERERKTEPTQRRRNIKGRGIWYDNSCDSDSYNSTIAIEGGDGEKKRIQFN